MDVDLVHLLGGDVPGDVGGPAAVGGEDGVIVKVGGDAVAAVVAPALAFDRDVLGTFGGEIGLNICC